MAPLFSSPYSNWVLPAPVRRQGRHIFMIKPYCRKHPSACLAYWIVSNTVTRDTYTNNPQSTHIAWSPKKFSYCKSFSKQYLHIKISFCCDRDLFCKNSCRKGFIGTFSFCFSFIGTRKEASYSDSKCKSKGGTCMDNSNYCTGNYLSGQCGGPAGRQCCTKTSAGMIHNRIIIALCNLKFVSIANIRVYAI